jgi:hypothetical protein
MNYSNIYQSIILVNNLAYEIFITLNQNYLKISLEENKKPPRKIYLRYFTYDDLLKKCKIFNQFDDLNKIFNNFKEIINNSNYTIECFQFFIKFNILNRSFLIIPEIDKNHNEIINTLFNEKLKKEEEIKKIKNLIIENMNKMFILLNNFNNIQYKINNLKNYNQRIINFSNKINILRSSILYLNNRIRQLKNNS